VDAPNHLPPRTLRFGDAIPDCPHINLLFFVNTTRGSEKAEATDVSDLTSLWWSSIGSSSEPEMSIISVGMGNNGFCGCEVDDGGG
jgi:hypothetical protein